MASHLKFRRRLVLAGLAGVMCAIVAGPALASAEQWNTVSEDTSPTPGAWRLQPYVRTHNTSGPIQFEANNLNAWCRNKTNGKSYYWLQMWNYGTGAPMSGTAVHVTQPAATGQNVVYTMVTNMPAVLKFQDYEAMDADCYAGTIGGFGQGGMPVTGRMYY